MVPLRRSKLRIGLRFASAVRERVSQWFPLRIRGGICRRRSVRQPGRWWRRLPVAVLKAAGQITSHKSQGTSHNPTDAIFVTCDLCLVKLTYNSRSPGGERETVLSNGDFVRCGGLLWCSDDRSPTGSA